MHVCVYMPMSVQSTGQLLCISASQKSNPFLKPFQCNFLFLLFFFFFFFFFVFFFFFFGGSVFFWKKEKDYFNDLLKTDHEISLRVAAFCSSFLSTASRHLGP